MWLNLSHFFIVVTRGYMCQMWSQLSHVQMSVMSKSPWCPNVHDVLMSMMSKCPWCPIVHDVVTLVTCDDTNDSWSHLSHVFTIVTCGNMWANLSQWSYNVTIFTCVKNFKKSSKEENDKKICSHRPYGCAEGKNKYFFKQKRSIS